METTQDKLIREKLNSLDTLPEGYAPSLDSKWELLIAGQPEPKKQPQYFWYAAAASLLLLLGFGFLFLETSKPAAEIVAKTQISMQTPPPASTEKQPVIQQKINTKNAIAKQEKTAETKIAFAKVASKNAMVLTPKTQAQAKYSENPEIELSAESNAIISQPAIGTAKESSQLAVAEIPKTTLKKKARFVEMDFEAPQKPLMAQRAPQPAKVQFKLKILPKETENTAVVQNENPLRLQHTF